MGVVVTSAAFPAALKGCNDLLFAGYLPLLVVTVVSRIHALIGGLLAGLLLRASLEGVRATRCGPVGHGLMGQQQDDDNKREPYHDDTAARNDWAPMQKQAK